MKRSKGNIIVPLESSIGELRPNEHGAYGLDLWPGALADIERLHKAQHALVLLLPASSGLAEGHLPQGVPEGIELMVSGTREGALAPGFTTAGRTGETVFVSADRQARAAARQQLSALPVPHLQAAGWLLAGTEPRQHGSLELLLPSPELLVEPVDPEALTRQAVRGGAALAEGPHPLADAATAEPVSAALALALPDAATFHSDCRRYSGQQPLAAGVTITSRHVRHADNARAVSALVTELTALGYCTYTHGFAHGGVTLNNVIADMHGPGYFRIKPGILTKVQAVLTKLPPRTPWPEIERALMHELGRPTVTRLLAAAGGPQRTWLEAVAGMHRWLPCWRKPGALIGIGSQLVVLGCHLDSAADRTSGYVSATDPAPGMDDNASGIAACLATARYLAGFRGRLVHNVRLCFFNAEEAGLVGSKAYAAYLKATGAPVKAVLCADMLGYNSDAFRLFEIHAGFTDATVRDRSLAAATRVQSWAASLGVLMPAQLYKGTSPSAGAPDRELYDPAINHSDHAAFHQQGYGAALVSEDYFGNLASEPAKDPNPNYHMAGDLTVDADYGAAIAAALACAMKDLAT